MIDIDYRRMFRHLPSPHMMLDRDLRFVDVSDSYLRMTERSREALIGRPVFDAFPETGARLEAVRTAFERALAGEANTLDRQAFSIALPDGRSRDGWFRCHQVPVLDAHGRPVALVQQAEDVTSEVMGERMRAALSGEFDHRVKNLLATVGSIARRSARSAQSTEAYVADFEARIQAMAQTHQLLVDGGWDRLRLDELLGNALAPYRDGARVVEISGPVVDLTGRQAQALGLAFHELAVNSARYGALDGVHGRLDVAWSAQAGESGAARMLEITWREAGLHGLKTPERTGFGTVLIERVLPAEIEGTIERAFLPTGLSCTIRLPLARNALDAGSRRAPDDAAEASHRA